MTGLSDNLRQILDLMVSDPKAAATRLEKMAAELIDLAGQLRSGDSQRDVGGMVDRVKTRVVGPNGNIVIETDTGT